MGRALGIDPQNAPVRFGTPGEAGQSIVLLKKDGVVYGSRDTSELDKETSKAISIVQDLLGDAIDRRATEIHMELRASEVQIRFRVDGLLQQHRSLDYATGRAVVLAIKELSDMEVARRQRRQEGMFAVLSDDQRFKVRVSSIPVIYGEHLAMRLRDTGAGVLQGGLGALGFRDSIVRKVREIVDQPSGMLIICGPTGHGKTTTAYAAISELDGLVRNIVTIQDLAQVSLPDVFRQDPDVVFVGEIHDEATAAIAIRLALTGHFVVTTLRARDAANAIGKLIEIGPDANLIGLAVTAVVAQRLFRKLCTSCKVAYTPTAEELHRHGLSARRASKLYRANPQGCDSCLGRGHLGRTAVCEVIVMDDEIRRVLVGRTSEVEIRAALVRHQKKTLFDEILYQAETGVISLCDLEDDDDDEVGGVCVRA
jgi:type II secretory ATPase GspE/PulE/Tfp pilus assembly ATPase PilB-like protein